MQIINENEMHERLVEKNAKRRNLLESKGDQNPATYIGSSWHRILNLFKYVDIVLRQK